MNLVEWVSVGSPVSKEQAEPNGFKHACHCTDGNSIERALFGENLGNELINVNITSHGYESVRRTLGAELAKKIRLPKYAAPL